MGRLALLFILVPILELMLLIRLGQAVGLVPTLALILFTGLAGAYLARREGWKAFRRFSGALARGELPADAALDGIAVLIGGAFLLTPGILTDVVGFSLLLPPIRAGFKKRLVRWARTRLTSAANVRFQVFTAGGTGGPGGWPAGSGVGENISPVRPSTDPNEIVVESEDRTLP